VSNTGPPSQPALEQVLRILNSNLPERRDQYPVKSLGVFGSYARERTKRRSDLDLLLEFDRVPTIFEFMRLERHLATVPGVKVDLTMKSTLKPKLGE
jgi:hypothetical protein